jgi:hypothetical protein
MMAMMQSGASRRYHVTNAMAAKVGSLAARGVLSVL